MEVPHVGQLLEQGEVAEVEAQRDRLHLACSRDHGRRVRVGVTRVPESSVGFDRVDEGQRHQAPLGGEVDAL